MALQVFLIKSVKNLQNRLFVFKRQFATQDNSMTTINIEVLIYLYLIAKPALLETNDSFLFPCSAAECREGSLTHFEPDCDAKRSLNAMKQSFVKSSFS